MHYLPYFSFPNNATSIFHNIIISLSLNCSQSYLHICQTSTKINYTFTIFGFLNPPIVRNKHKALNLFFDIVTTLQFYLFSLPHLKIDSYSYGLISLLSCFLCSPWWIVRFRTCGPYTWHTWQACRKLFPVKLSLH